MASRYEQGNFLSDNRELDDPFFVGFNGGFQIRNSMLQRRAIIKDCEIGVFWCVFVILGAVGYSRRFFLVVSIIYYSINSLFPIYTLNFDPEAI
jgi:hypothetical protein